MSFKRFEQAKPFVTLSVIIFAWLLLPVAVKSFLRVTFFELQAPVQATASYVRDLQEYWAQRAHSKDDLIAAARELRHVYSGYEFQAQQAEARQAEIARLEQLLRLPPNPACRYEPARVCRRDMSVWWQQLTIRKGANYDLPIGAPVVFSGGVVGRVREVRAYEADVDLVSSPRLRLAATFEDDARPVSYQGGDNPALAPAHGLVEFVPPDIIVYSSSPRRLITSGLGEFPPGLTIGYVTRLETGTDGLFQNGEVSLDPRLSELTEVTVLVPLRPN